MAEGDTTGRGGTPTPDGHPTGERDAADRERRSDAGKTRGTGGEESPEVFARPSWDHAKDFPEPLAEGRTSTAVAIGLVAAALLGFRKLPFEADPSRWVSFADGGAAELVKAMLSRAPDARPSAVQALRAATKLAASARN